MKDVEALLLKRSISDGEHLVDQQDVRVDLDRDGEGEPDLHPRRVVLELQLLELGQLGAYGACLRTGFNGFGRADVVEVADLPMLETPGYE